MTTEPLTDLEFDHYLRHMISLHRFIREGRGDSDDAQLERDFMEKPYYRQTPLQLRTSEAIGLILAKWDEAKSDD